MYIVPFLRHSKRDPGTGVGVIQGHWKWRRSMAVCCTIFDLFDVE